MRSCFEAPRMSGSRMDDHLASIDLARSALHWALSFLRHNGTFVSRWDETRHAREKVLVASFASNYT